MLTLPTERKIWKCGERWIDGQKVQTKDGCGFEIYQSTKVKFDSGKFMICNFRDCVGGLKDEKHVCPVRVGSKFHHTEPLSAMRIEQQHREKFCGICLDTYDSIVMPLCPHCFKLECRKCDNLQSWIAGNGLVCFACGARCDVRQIWNRYQMLYGRYEF